MDPYPAEMVPDIDLGDDHFLTFHRWAPDDLPANRDLYGIPAGEPMPVVDRWGATIRHYRPDGTLCEGCITFDGSWQRKAHECSVRYYLAQGKPPPPYVVWTVESWNPLTCSPSLLCRMPIQDADGKKVGECGDHGFIRNGRWVRA